MKENELKNMSISERTQAMERLWDSLLHEDIAIKSPDWHEEILQKRKEKIENGSANFISLNELKKYSRENH